MSKSLIQVGCNIGDEHIFQLIKDEQINLCIFIDANKTALEQCLQNSKEFFKDANWEAKFEFINCAVSNLPDEELEFHIPNDEHGHNGGSSLFANMVEQDYMLEMQSKLDKVCNGIDVMSDKQEQMSEDIAKIKEAVYNPDQGLYARIRELETWKRTSSRMIWTLFTTMIGLIGAFILKNLGV